MWLCVTHRWHAIGNAEILNLGSPLPRHAISVYNVRMARLNVYVPDELADRARKAGLNVSAITQAAISAELTRQSMSAWVATLPPSSGRVSHEEVLAAIDAGRDDFGRAR